MEEARERRKSIKRASFLSPFGLVFSRPYSSFLFPFFFFSFSGLPGSEGRHEDSGHGRRERNIQAVQARLTGRCGSEGCWQARVTGGQYYFIIMQYSQSPFRERSPRSRRKKGKTMLNFMLVPYAAYYYTKPANKKPATKMIPLLATPKTLVCVPFFSSSYMYNHAIDTR